jgi:dTMP kinase
MFLVFEGVDGSGKTTQARRLADHLEARGRDVTRVREPGGTALGEVLRDLVLHPRHGDIAPETELFLFMAARAHLTRNVIRPALERGGVVISDRFLWSSVVYQGVSSGISFDEILRVGRIAVGGLEPQLTFVIDIEPEGAFARVRDRNRMENRGLDYQRGVRDGFLSLARRFPETSVVIDGRGSPEEVFSRVLANLPPER